MRLNISYSLFTTVKYLKVYLFILFSSRITHYSKLTLHTSYTEHYICIVYLYHQYSVTEYTSIIQ